MRVSLVNSEKLLPESWEDFQALAPATRSYRICCQCEEAFSPENTHSTAGWAETQISGVCEDCFDSLFDDEEEERK